MLSSWAEQVPAAVPVRAQGLPADHPQQPSGRRGRIVGLLSPGGQCAGRAAGPHPVPAPAHVREGSEPAAELPRAGAPTWRAALEFRHACWFTDEVYDTLRARDIALVAVDEDESEGPGSPLVPTASWGYLRMRRTSYSTSTLGQWGERIRASRGPRHTSSSSTRRECPNRAGGSAGAGATPREPRIR